MQIVSKIEPSSPLSTTSSIITPKSSKDLMQAITKRLLSGKESANHLRNLYIKRLGLKVEENDDDDDNTNKNNFDDQHLFYHHLGVTLNSFDACISLIKSHDFDQQEIMNKKRKVDDQNIDDDDHSSKSQDTFDANKVSKERRGCYKRRKTGQSWSIEATTLTDDGHAWRKYGQKEILHTKYPRNYYRCTHKHEQNCQATKQVQQISEDPTKYNIIYNGQHTCKNLHKTPSLIIDDPQEQNPSFFLSFGSNNYPTSKHALNPPMFPSTTFHNNNTSTTTTTTTTTFVKEESSPPMVAPNDHDHDHGTHKQYPSSPSSSDNNHPSSSSLSYDVTSTRLSSSLASTPVSEQSDVISPPEFYSSTPSQYEIMDEEVFLGILNMKQDYFYPHLDELLND